MSSSAASRARGPTPSLVPSKRSATEDTNGDEQSCIQDSVPTAKASRNVRFRSIASTSFTKGLGSATEEGESEIDVESTMVRHELRTLCFSANRERIGAAFYEPNEKTLSFLEDADDSRTFDLAINIIQQLRPTMILLSSKTSDGLTLAVEGYCTINQECQYHIRSEKEFWISSALDRLSQIRLPPSRKIHSMTSDVSRSANSQNKQSVAGTQPTRCSRSITDVDTFMSASNGTGSTLLVDDESEEEKKRRALLRLGCHMNMNANMAISSAGALIYQLEREAMSSGQTGDLKMRKVESIALDQYMLMNEDALFSLSIFADQDFLPASERAGVSFSLFSIFSQQLTTRPGYQRLKLWFQRPLLQLEDIIARQANVHTCLRTPNAQLVQDIKRQLSAVKNVHSLLNEVTKAGLAPWYTWHGLVNFCYGVVAIQTLVSQAKGRDSSDLSNRLQVGIAKQEIVDLANELTGRIDWDSSKVEGTLVIQSGFDEVIDTLTERLATLDETLDRAARHVAKTLPENLVRELQVKCFPQIGYVIEVTPVEGVDLMEEMKGVWNFRWRSDELFYFKNTETNDLDIYIGDLQTALRERVIDIMVDMQDRVVDVEGLLLDAGDLMGEVDCLLAFAAISQSYGLVRPNMDEDNIIAIKSGRHMLYELTTETYIANDTFLVGGQGMAEQSQERFEDEEEGEKIQSLMLITGPNGSGKSAYGKQVALICFLAQVGCFVPAVSATLGVIDRIFTRVQTKESVSKAASAFMIDLSQVSLALRGSTSRSLILLDEFGKGTSPEDGAGLLVGVLYHLLHRDGGCPKVIAITHFHELITNRFLPSAKDYIWQMRTVYEKAQDDEQSGQSLAFLYQLSRSASLASHAIECAQMQGLEDDVIARARVVLAHLRNYEYEKIKETAVILTDEEKQAAMISEALIEQAEDLTKEFIDVDWENMEEEDMFENLTRLMKSGDDEIEEFFDTDELTGTVTIPNFPTTMTETGMSNNGEEDGDDVDDVDDDDTGMDTSSRLFSESKRTA